MIEEKPDRFFVVEGAKLERLTIVEPVSDLKHHPLYFETKRCHIQQGRVWLCRCDCGKEVLVSEFSLERRKNKSCGCLRRDIIKRKETEKSEYRQYSLERVKINAEIQRLRIELKYEQIRSSMLRDESKIEAISQLLRSAYAKKASLAASYHKTVKKKREEAILALAWEKVAQLDNT